MFDDERFNKIYKKIIDENFSEIENLRKKALLSLTEQKKEKIFAFIIFLLLSFGLFITIFNQNTLDYEIILEILIVYITAFPTIIAAILCKKHINSSKYITEYKSKIIKPLICSFEEHNLSYFPDSGTNGSICSKVYNEADFKHCNILFSDDLIKGTLNGNNNFAMADCESTLEVKTSEGYARYVLFVGLFSKIELSKNFNSTLYIRASNSDVLNKFENYKVQMDLPEFEQAFNVFSYNKILAMQILTHDIMEILLQFSKEITFDLTIKNSCLYIRFHTGPMFEASKLEKSAFDRETLYKYYKILDFTFTLTDKLINVINDTEYDN